MTGLVSTVLGLPPARPTGTDLTGTDLAVVDVSRASCRVDPMRAMTATTDNTAASAARLGLCNAAKAAEMERANEMYRSRVRSALDPSNNLLSSIDVLYYARRAGIPRLADRFISDLCLEENPTLLDGTIEAILFRQVLVHFHLRYESPDYLQELSEALFRRIGKDMKRGNPQFAFMSELDREASELAVQLDISYDDYTYALWCDIVGERIQDLASGSTADKVRHCLRAPWLIDTIIDVLLGPFSQMMHDEGSKWSAFVEEAPTFEAFTAHLDRGAVPGIQPLAGPDLEELDLIKSLYPNIPSVTKGYWIEPGTRLPFPYNVILVASSIEEASGWWCQFPIFMARSDLSDHKKASVIRHEAIHSLVSHERICYFLSQMGLENEKLQYLFLEGITELLTRHAGEVLDEAATQAGVQTPEDLMASDEDFNATLAAVGRIPGDTYKRPVTLAIALARTLGFHRFMMLFTSSDQQDHYQLTAAEISILRPIFEELIKIIDKHVAIASEATELTPQVAHEMFDLFRKITLLRPTR